MTKISIIIPVYNVENWLEECLESTINQSLKDIEILCIDDGSTDNSLTILNNYHKKDKRVKVFHQNNLGAASARNFGISKANGKYILFVDSDDWIDLSMCEELYNHMEHLGSDMCLFNSIEHKKNNILNKRIYFTEKEFKEDFNNFTFDYTFKKNMVMNGMMVIWSKIYRTSFLNDNGLKFRNHEIFNDVQFHIESMLTAKKISYFPKIFYHYRRLGQSSLQNTKAVTEKGFIIFDIMKEIKEYLVENKFMDEFKYNYLRFVLTELEGRLNRTDNNYKERLFDKIFSFLTHFIHISDYELNQIPFKNIKFYIHVINSNSYFEFIRFNNHSFVESEVILFNQICEKNKIISNYETEIDLKNEELEVYNNITKDFLDSNSVNLCAFKKIMRCNLFDYEWYISNYNYKLDLDQCLHYIYKGWKENKNPNPYFNSNYYLKSTKAAKDSGLNPLVYFVNYGLDKGEIKVNPSVHQPKAINKFELMKKLKKFNKKGTSDKKRNPRIIVSLTSYPKRINTIKFTLFSLFNQSLKPDKIVLWLANENFPNRENDIPKDVLKFKKFGLEIDWCDDIKSFKKLIPSLKKYPNDLIVTVDDDIYLDKDWLKKLYEEYLKNPECIICHRTKCIIGNKKGDYIISIKPYNEWPLSTHEQKPSYINFITGGAGALYPPNSLDNDIFNKELFMKLCSTSDDIWFYCMALKKGTKIKCIPNNFYQLTYVNPAEEVGLFNSTETLWHINSKGQNDINLDNVLKKFPEIKKLILKSLNEE